MFIGAVEQRLPGGFMIRRNHTYLFLFCHVNKYVWKCVSCCNISGPDAAKALGWEADRLEQASTSAQIHQESILNFVNQFEWKKKEEVSSMAGNEKQKQELRFDRQTVQLIRPVLNSELNSVQIGQKTPTFSHGTTKQKKKPSYKQNNVAVPAEIVRGRCLDAKWMRIY